MIFKKKIDRLLRMGELVERTQYPHDEMAQAMLNELLVIAFWAWIVGTWFGAFIVLMVWRGA